MAIYHINVKIIGRSSGRSSVAAAAYRAGEKLHNEHDGTTHNYDKKAGVVHAEIMLPENAPTEFQNRETLWNAVEQSEKRKDARTAREVELALPIEFNLQEQVEIVKVYIEENFTEKGMCADFAIHDKGDGNPHAHILLTTREVSKDGFGGKNREWNKVEHLESWRESWARVCNEKFKEKGLSVRIDHRTLEEQGIDREPTIHTGRSPNKIMKNREIMQRNAEKIAVYMHELREGYIILDKEIKQGGNSQFVANKDLFMLEYQRQKLLMEISPYTQRVQELLKEYHIKGNSLEERMTRLKSESRLDMVTEKNFRDILETLRPEQAEVLIAQREREFARSFEREH